MAPELAHALTALDPVELGARIKAARVAAGLTQPSLAGADASVAFLSRIESGQRRPSAELLEALADRLGVNVDYLVLGDGWEDARRLELQLDHAELSLAGGEASNSLQLARDVLNQSGLESVAGGPVRARYVEAAALDALGDPSATTAFQKLLVDGHESAIRLKAATALCRIWREHGQLDRAISVAQSELDHVPAEALGSEEGIRLSVTLAAALFVAGRADEAAELCDRAIAESELAEALPLAKRALHLLENTERVRDVGRLRTQLSAIMLRSDPPRLEDAQEQLRLADSELDWSEANPADKARHDLVNAQALLMDGDTERAHERAMTVLAATSGELPLISVDALTVLGQISWTTGDRDAARDWYRRAITTLTGFGADREAAQTWFEIGTLAAQAGLVAESADAFRRAAASTGLRARLPVINEPTESAPRSKPSNAPVTTG